jgi:type I restriction enzyme, S subunit
MTAASSIALERIMPPRLGSIDPSAFPDEEFDLYSIPAFDQGEPEVLEGGAIGSAKQIVQPGDVLLSRIVPHIRRAWVVGQDRGRRIIASGEWIVFRGEDIDQRYLRHVLVSDPFHAEFMRTVSGVGGSLLRARPAYVAKIKIPLPSLPEQQRIAEILDRADALRAKRRAALAQLDNFTQSIFLDMFGDPATNPKGWEMKPLGDVATLQRGFDLPVQERREGSVPIFAANGPVGTHDVHRVNGPGVVTGRSGTLGKVHYVKEDFWPLNTALWVKDFHGNDPVWVCELLRLMRLEQFTRGVGVPTLNRNLVHVVDVPLPPIDSQHRFAAVVERVGRSKASQCVHLQELDVLTAALQQRAFRGEL